MCREDDPFLPAYEIQLLGYTHLIEANQIGEVATAALVYFENSTKDKDLDPLDLLTNRGFDIPFRAMIHEVDIDRADLHPLIENFRGIADLRYPPQARKGCDNCARLQKLLDDEVKRRNGEDTARQTSRLARATSRELEADRQAARAAWSRCDAEDRTHSASVLDSVPGPMDL
jgi:hypothetical protein